MLGRGGGGSVASVHQREIMVEKKKEKTITTALIVNGFRANQHHNHPRTISWANTTYITKNNLFFVVHAPVMRSCVVFPIAALILVIHVYTLITTD